LVSAQQGQITAGSGQVKKAFVISLPKHYAAF